MNGFTERKTLLIISSNQMVCDIVQFELSREGYRVFAAVKWEQGSSIIRRRRADAVILDSFHVEAEIPVYCAEIRQNDESIPIIILGVTGYTPPSEIAKMSHIARLEKPIPMMQLKKVVMELIQRTSAFLGRDIYLPAGSEITISTEEYQVFKRGEPIALTQTEYELFVFLASHPGKVYSRAVLLERVWNYESTGNDVRMVDVAIRRLRTKIEDDPTSPCLICTKRGAGYYFPSGREN